MDINELDDDDLMLDQNLEEDEESLDLNDGVWASDLKDDDGGNWIHDDNDSEDDDSYNEDDEVDAITSFLKDNGIDDPDKIKFENESGEIEERSWNDLSEDEKLNILRSNLREPEEGLDDEEIDFINQLRAQGLTPSSYQALLQLLMQQYVLLAIANNLQEPELTYSSDLLNDDELFILDLLARVPDITDDELKTALINAKSNEDLYNKQISGLRAEYQRLESESKERDEAIRQLEYQELYAQYSNAVVNEISSLYNIGDLDINMDEAEMNELADFILTSDESGENYFNKALKDPLTLVLMAWFALHGEEIFNGISDYYNLEIENARLEAFAQGVASVKPTKQNTTEVVYKPSQKENTKKSYKDISDLDD